MGLLRLYGNGSQHAIATEAARQKRQIHFEENHVRHSADNVLYHRKQGFAVPLDHWFRHELKEMAYTNIIAQTDGILDHGLLKKIWNQHQSGQYTAPPTSGPS